MTTREGASDASPDVTAIVAVARPEGVGGTLDSLLGQSGLRVETLVVDGDRSGADPGRHAAAVESSLEAALARARGDYVCFLEAGDRLAAPDALALWTARARRDGLDMTRANHRVVEPRRGGERLAPGTYRETDGDWAGALSDRPRLANAASRREFLYDRRFLDKWGARTGVAPTNDDRIFAFATLLAAGRVGLLPRATLIVRDRPDAAPAPTAEELAAAADRVMRLARWIEASAGPDAAARPAGMAEALGVNYALMLRDLAGRLRDVVTGALRVGDDAGRAAAEAYLKALAALGAVSLAPGRRLRDLRDLLSPERSSFTSWAAKCVDPEARCWRVDLLAALLREGDLAGVAALLGGAELSFPAFRAALAARPRAPETRAAMAGVLRHARRASAPPFDLDPLAVWRAPDAPRILLHGGMPKTGSTAIQAWFERRRFALREAGVLYPATGQQRETRPGREGRISGHTAVLGEILRGRDRRFAALSAEVAIEMEEGRRGRAAPLRWVALSSELILSPHLWTGPQTLRRLRGAFGPADVVFAALRRTPADWLRSYHAERVANPYSDESRDLAAFTAALADFAPLHDPRFEETVAAAFGRAGTRIAAYEAVRRGPGVSAWIAALLDLDAAWIENAEDLAGDAAADINESHPPERVEAARTLRLAGLEGERLAGVLDALSPAADGAAPRVGPLGFAVAPPSAPGAALVIDGIEYPAAWSALESLPAAVFVDVAAALVGRRGALTVPRFAALAQLAAGGGAARARARALIGGAPNPFMAERAAREG